MNIMRYKNYCAQIEYDDTADSFHGYVIGIRDVIDFYGKTIEELRHEFAESVTVYEEMCAQDGVDPEKPFTGKFTLRIEQNEHRNLVLAATLSHQSLNAWARSVLTSEAQRLIGE